MIRNLSKANLKKSKKLLSNLISTDHTQIKTARFYASSSVLEYLEYGMMCRTVRVKYLQGKYKGMVRSYPKVSQEDFEEIVQAESIGRKWLEYVKAKQKGNREYNYEK